MLATGAFPGAAPEALSFPVPANPALSGLELHLQAWCQQGLFGPGLTWSFTNAAAAVL